MGREDELHLFLTSPYDVHRFHQGCAAATGGALGTVGRPMHHVRSADIPAPTRQIPDHFCLGTLLKWRLSETSLLALLLRHGLRPESGPAPPRKSFGGLGTALGVSFPTVSVVCPSPTDLSVRNFSNPSRSSPGFPKFPKCCPAQHFGITGKKPGELRVRLANSAPNLVRPHLGRRELLLPPLSKAGQGRRGGYSGMCPAASWHRQGPQLCSASAGRTQQSRCRHNTHTHCRGTLKCRCASRLPHSCA